MLYQQLEAEAAALRAALTYILLNPTESNMGFGSQVLNRTDAGKALFEAYTQTK
jgi:hypothetical protein